MMKKILLTTTAIASLAASAAFAEGASVKLIGKVDAQMGFTNQKTKNPNTNSILGDTYSIGNISNSKTNFRNVTELGAEISGKTDSGVSYGGVILTEGENLAGPNRAPYQTHSPFELKRGYVYASYDTMGKIELGANEGADEAMKIGAQSIAVATGGVDGDFDNFINKNAHLMGVVANTGMPTTRGSFLFAPSIYGTNDSELRRSNKVTIYSPKAYGFQLGVSYAPNFTAQGDAGPSATYLASTTTSMTTDSIRDMVSGGISYQNQFDQFGFAASATGAFGKARKAYVVSGSVPSNQAYNDVKSYNLGAKITYNNFALAGSYGDMKNSFLRKDAGSYANIAANGINVLNNSKRSHYWTAGAAYTQGPVAASVTYFNADNYGNKTEVVSIGADYALAPGFKPYAELSFYELKSAKDLTNNNVVTKNSGNVVIVGAKLQF